jgi:hypothetical protein
MEEEAGSPRQSDSGASTIRQPPVTSVTLVINRSYREDLPTPAPQDTVSWCLFPSFTAQTSQEGSIAMSHHLDTPLASQNGQLYIDDL